MDSTTTTTKSNVIVVTRHKDLVALLLKRGLITSETPVLEHTDNIADVEGKDVIGVVPAKLGILTHSVTEVPLNIPRALRGCDIPLEQLEGMAGTEVTYKVERTETRTDFKGVVVTTLSTTALQYYVREGIVERGGPEHMAAAQRTTSITRTDVERKAVLGHIPYHLAQYALDVSTVALYYDYSRRGLVHTYQEMKSHNPQLFTYKVKRVS